MFGIFEIDLRQTGGGSSGATPKPQVKQSYMNQLLRRFIAFNLRTNNQKDYHWVSKLSIFPETK